MKTIGQQWLEFRAAAEKRMPAAIDEQIWEVLRGAFYAGATAMVVSTAGCMSALAHECKTGAHVTAANLAAMAVEKLVQ